MAKLCRKLKWLVFFWDMVYIMISVVYLGGELFSLQSAAPSPEQDNSNYNEDDRDNDAAERDDDFDSLVERRFVSEHNMASRVCGYHIVSRRLELEKAVDGTGRTARGHSHDVPRGWTDAHAVHSLYT